MLSRARISRGECGSNAMKRAGDGRCSRRNGSSRSTIRRPPCLSFATVSAIWLAIVAELAARYTAPPAVIEKDVVAMLVDLKTKRVLET